MELWVACCCCNREQGIYAIALLTNTARHKKGLMTKLLTKPWVEEMMGHEGMTDIKRFIDIAEVQERKRGTMGISDTMKIRNDEENTGKTITAG